MLRGLILSSLFVCTSLLSDSINVAVAANVSYAIKDIVQAFNKHHPDTKINITLGSSGKLTAQIKHGAPYQVFMSANMLYPRTLHRDKIAVTEPLVYAQGSLALLSHTPLSSSQNLELLIDSKIKKIAIANPKTAPYGKATQEALKNAHIYDNIKRKFVYGESISQTVSYAVTATDVGIIATSSLYSPHMKRFEKGIHWREINPKLYTPIEQGIVVLKPGENDPNVKLFYTFIFTKEAASIFKKFGYTTP